MGRSSAATGQWGRYEPPYFDFGLVETEVTRGLTDPAGALPKLLLVSAPTGYGKTVLLSTLYRTLEARGARCGPVTEQRWGLVTSVAVPGGAELGLYEPRHPTAISLSE